MISLQTVQLSSILLFNRLENKLNIIYLPKFEIFVKIILEIMDCFKLYAIKVFC
jgi:hypothetical protein